MKKYIIGIGTGRCGSKTLTQLLNDCSNCNFRHEWVIREKKTFRRIYANRGKKLLTWNFNLEKAQERLKELKELKGKIVGDIGYFYLNYIDYFMNNLSNLKIIHLERDKKAHLKSQMKVGLGLRIEHKHKALPVFPYAKTIEDSINKYWELYKREVAILKCKYPGKILTIKTENLSKNHIQKIIFDFIEIPKQNRIYQSIRRV